MIVAISSILDYTGNYCVHYPRTAPLQNYCGCLKTLCTNFPWEIKISSGIFDFVIAVAWNRTNIMTRREKNSSIGIENCSRCLEYSE